MKIGIFGGSFNPPHKGHRNAAEACLRQLELDCLYIIPANDPPHKDFPEGTPPPAARLEMTRLLFSGLEKTFVLDLELKRSGLSFTVDTIAQIGEKHLGAQLFLLMGTDMFLSLNSWHRAKDLLGLARPAVFCRKPGQKPSVLEKSQELLEIYGVDSVFIDHDILELCSTDLRAQFANRTGQELVGETLYGEIVRQAYYGAKAQLSYLRQQVAVRVSAKRFLHTQKTEEEARRLAIRWGVCPQLAQEAAILHDLTKDASLGEHLWLCEKYGTMQFKHWNKKLLHAKTGAYLARDLFGVTQEVFDAISYHTTGRAGMSLLEQVIYMADFIEPSRDFTGVDELRELAYTDLSNAMARGLEMTILELAEKGLEPQADTLEALEYFKN